MSASLPASYFAEVYATSTDPWGFADRWYEERKRALTLAALPARRFATAYEPGCSIGVLTVALAERCDDLLATDPSERALGAARARLAGRPGVRLERSALPGGWPAGTFDLVVLSEVLYYLGDDDLADVVGRAAAAVAPGGALVSVHWRHPVADYPQSGDAVQAAVAGAAGGLVLTATHLEADLALSVHVRPGVGEAADRVSVAAREGLA